MVLKTLTQKEVQRFYKHKRKLYKQNYWCINTHSITNKTMLHLYKKTKNIYWLLKVYLAFAQLLNLCQVYQHLKEQLIKIKQINNNTMINLKDIHMIGQTNNCNFIFRLTNMCITWHQPMQKLFIV